MKIEVGDRVTGKVEGINQTIREIIINDGALQTLNENIKKKRVKIIKIERPEYKIKAKRKEFKEEELLTNEERKLLEIIIKVSMLKINFIERYNYTLKFKDCDKKLVTDITTKEFQGLENKREYTLSELRIVEK